jgi:hypothetical protein
MNCTTWNSVRAKALASRPNAVPSSASAIATTKSSQTDPFDLQSAHQGRVADGHGGLQDGEQSERQRVSEDEVTTSQRHRQQTLERSAASFTQGRDARDEEHDDEREEREHRRPDVGEHIRFVEDPGHESDQQARHDEQQGDRARIVPDLDEDTSRGRQSAHRVHRRPPFFAARPATPRPLRESR